MTYSNCLRQFLAVLIALSVTFSVQAQTQTPSHAYQMSEEIVREIRILREAVGADDYPSDPDQQMLKRPGQVYGKGQELLYKVGYAQRKFGLPAVEPGSIPVKQIAPSDVVNLCAQILSELRKIKTYLAVPTPIEEVQFVDGKVPSNVYENLWRASYMMDYLSGAIKPNDVFRYTNLMVEEVGILARANNINLEGVPIPEIKPNIRPKDVAAQGVQNLHKMIRIEKKLGYPSSIVPTMTLSRADPADVFDIVGMQMSELTYLKFKGGVTESASIKDQKEVEGKVPADVLQRMEYAGSMLDRLLAGVRRK